jgi:hypothetical protein
MLEADKKQFYFYICIHKKQVGPTAQHTGQGIFSQKGVLSFQICQLFGIQMFKFLVNSVTSKICYNS